MRKRMHLTYEEFIKENMKVSVIDRSNQDLVDIELKVEETEELSEEENEAIISGQVPIIVMNYDDFVNKGIADKV